MANSLSRGRAEWLLDRPPDFVSRGPSACFHRTSAQIHWLEEVDERGFQPASAGWPADWQVSCTLPDFRAWQDAVRQNASLRSRRATAAVVRNSCRRERPPAGLGLGRTSDRSGCILRALRPVSQSTSLCGSRLQRRGPRPSEPRLPVHQGQPRQPQGMSCHGYSARLMLLQSPARACSS